MDRFFHKMLFLAANFSTCVRDDKMASLTPTPSYELPIRVSGRADSRDKEIEVQVKPLFVKQFQKRLNATAQWKLEPKHQRGSFCIRFILPKSPHF